MKEATPTTGEVDGDEESERQEHGPNDDRSADQ